MSKSKPYSDCKIQSTIAIFLAFFSQLFHRNKRNMWDKWNDWTDFWTDWVDWFSQNYIEYFHLLFILRFQFSFFFIVEVILDTCTNSVLNKFVVFTYHIFLLLCSMLRSIYLKWIEYICVMGWSGCLLMTSLNIDT